MTTKRTPHTESDRPHRGLPVFTVPLLFVIAFLIRLALVPNPGFEADVAFWKSWGLGPFDHGLVWSMHNTNNNYPTPFAYLLWILTWIYSLFADPHNFNQYWTDTNGLFLTIAKMPAILADFGIAGLIMAVGARAKRFSFPELPQSLYITLALAYLFSPLSLIDGALWGQVDSLGVLVYLAAAVLAFRKKPFLAGAVYMVGLMTKLQNMIYGPLLFLFVWQDMGLAGLGRSLAGAVLAFFGLNIEFILAHDMGRVWSSLTDNYDYFPLLSLNAYNLWWIVAHGNGMHVSDKIAAVGLLTAKKTGLYIFIAGYLLACLAMAKDTLWGIRVNRDPDADSPVDRETRIRNFLIALVVAASTFFLFQTESHDRYAFPVAVFYLVLAPFLLTSITGIRERVHFWKTRAFRWIAAGYVAFTVVYFLNLHTALITNYPKNALFPWLNGLNVPSVTIGIAVAQLALFTVFLWAMRKAIGGAGIVVSVAALGLLIGSANLPLIRHTPVMLSTLTPMISMQDYGRRVENMPVNAQGDSGTWSRLSVQYIFYRKGIGTHAKSYIAYDINRKFTKFTTDYGVDTEAGAKGTVQFEIYGDDKLLFRSEIMKRYEFPGHAEVDVTGVKKLGLVVQDGGDGIADDHADWLDSQLWP